jgi:hypothetical protein
MRPKAKFPDLPKASEIPKRTPKQSELRIDALEGAREGDRLADVVDAADPGHGPFQAQPETAVWERTIAPEIQIPAVRLFR